MQETYTFSRALHMMRYGGKKMAFVHWKMCKYIEIKNDKLITNSGYATALTSVEILGSWVEVKDDKTNS